jgi:hypothetical protein
MSKIILSQPFLTQKIIDNFTTDSTLPRKIPIKDTNTLVFTGDDEEVINPNGYLSVVGSLNYLAVATRPNLAFAVGILAQFAKSPTSRHWTAIQQVLGYVKGLGCCQLVIEPKPTVWCSICAPMPKAELASHHDITPSSSSQDSYIYRVYLHIHLQATYIYIGYIHIHLHRLHTYTSTWATYIYIYIGYIYIHLHRLHTYTST